MLIRQFFYTAVSMACPYPLIFKHLTNVIVRFLVILGRLIEFLMIPENITHHNTFYTDARLGRLPSFFRNRFFILMIIFLSGSLTAQAQFGSSGGYDFGEGGSLYALSVTAGMDVPLGDVGTMYKASPFYNLQIVRNVGPLSFGLGGGIRMFKPKQDVFEEPINAVYNVPLDVVYTDMNTKMGYLTAIYNYEISEQLVAFGGLNVGFYNNTFTTSGSIYGNAVFKVYTMENCLYAAPKLGAGYKFGQMQVNLESRFNLIKSNNSVEYNARVGAAPSAGSFYKTWATGLSFVYNF